MARNFQLLQEVVQVVLEDGQLPEDIVSVPSEAAKPWRSAYVRQRTEPRRDRRQSTLP